MQEHGPIRKLMSRREIPGGIRFITFSCQRRLPLLNEAWICEAFLEALAAARLHLGAAIFAWVLMPEHVHMLCRPGDDHPMASVLRSVKMSVAKTVIARWKRSGSSMLSESIDEAGRARFWQAGGGFDRNVRDESEFSREVQYIHRNPVERGLVERPEDWRWSSVRWWMGIRDGEFICDPPPGRSWATWRGFV